MKNIEETLYQAAISLINSRYPTGWGGAAAMYTDNGMVLTSVGPEIMNASTELCMETGAILEAHKWNVSITHSICVVREDGKSPYTILTPCGICQERLFYWGSQVKAAVSNRQGELLFKSLAEIQPYHWSNAYAKE